MSDQSLGAPVKGHALRLMRQRVFSGAGPRTLKWLASCVCGWQAHDWHFTRIEARLDFRDHKKRGAP